MLEARMYLDRIGRRSALLGSDALQVHAVLQANERELMTQERLKAYPGYDKLEDQHRRNLKGWSPSDAQRRVMKWLTKGWRAHCVRGSAVEINGERVCNLDTIIALKKRGIVSNETRWTYMATELGREMFSDVERNGWNG